MGETSLMILYLIMAIFGLTMAVLYLANKKSGEREEK